VELAHRAVPKPDPSFDAAACGASSPLLPIRRVREQIFEQLTPFGTMIVAIEFDVSCLAEINLVVTFVPSRGNVALLPGP
jgi:hypothetical protein